MPPAYQLDWPTHVFHIMCATHQLQKSRNIQTITDDPVSYAVCKSMRLSAYMKASCYCLTSTPLTHCLYVQISEHAKLVQTLERFLVEYNSSSSKPMGLVFFQDAVDHIASIARVLRQPRGNALLVGVSGSGKQSLTRFAAALGGFTCVQLELTKAYSLTDFREDLKVCLHHTRCQTASTCNQIDSHVQYYDACLP